MGIKRIGIVIDNYKVVRYREELEKKQFKDYEIKPYLHDCSILRILTPENQIEVLSDICNELESYFAARKN